MCHLRDLHFTDFEIINYRPPIYIIYNIKLYLNMSFVLHIGEPTGSLGGGSFLVVTTIHNNDSTSDWTPTVFNLLPSVSSSPPCASDASSPTRNYIL